MKKFYAKAAQNYYIMLSTSNKAEIDTLTSNEEKAPKIKRSKSNMY